LAAGEDAAGLSMPDESGCPQVSLGWRYWRHSPPPGTISTHYPGPIARLTLGWGPVEQVRLEARKHTSELTFRDSDGGGERVQLVLRDRNPEFALLGTGTRIFSAP